jgi:hypothetical protein
MFEGLGFVYQHMGIVISSNICIYIYLTIYIYYYHNNNDNNDNNNIYNII